MFIIGEWGEKKLLFMVKIFSNYGILILKIFAHSGYLRYW